MIKLHNNILYIIYFIKDYEAKDIRFIFKALFVNSNTLEVFSYKTSYYMAIEYVFIFIICIVYG